MRLRALAFFVLLFALALIAGQAHGSSPQKDPAAAVTKVLLRIGAPIDVAANQAEHTVWVINDDVNVDGAVLEQLVVINGTAHVQGEVRGSVIIMNGRLELASTARVGRDVILYRSTVARAAGAEVDGMVRNEGGVAISRTSWWFLWGGATLTLIVAALVFSLLAEPSLEGAARSLTKDLRGTLRMTGLLLFGLPAAALFSVMTGVGIVLGAFIMFFLIPALAFLGYIVTGVMLGRKIMSYREWHTMPVFAAATVGLFLLQIATTIPGIGFLIIMLACPLGAGALLDGVWRRRHPAAPPAVMFTQMAAVP
jgi:hypothetical protein